MKALGLFLAVVILTFGTTLWYYVETLSENLEYDLGYVNEAEWYLLETVLHLKLTQAYDDGQEQRSRVLYDIKDLNEVQRAEYLDNLSSIGNPIRKAIYDAVINYRFDGIDNDANDSFIVRYQSGAWTIDLDSSGNCATVGEVREFAQEYPMHANTELAEIAFNRIKNGTVEDYSKAAIYKPIFFQFVSDIDGEILKENVPGYEAHHNKRAVILNSYDLKGLRTYFHKTESWEKTFRSFEFITPVYLDPRYDLAGRPYIKNGIRTSFSPIVINTVFNFSDVIKNMPEVKAKLDNYTDRRIELKRNYIRMERNLLIIIILLSVALFMSLLYADNVAKGEEFGNK